jgi:hypothetical protein
MRLHHLCGLLLCWLLGVAQGDWDEALGVLAGALLFTPLEDLCPAPNPTPCVVINSTFTIAAGIGVLGKNSSILIQNTAILQSSCDGLNQECSLSFAAPLVTIDQGSYILAPKVYVNAANALSVTEGSALDSSCSSSMMMPPSPSIPPTVRPGTAAGGVGGGHGGSGSGAGETTGCGSDASFGFRWGGAGFGFRNVDNPTDFGGGSCGGSGSQKSSLATHIDRAHELSKSLLQATVAIDDGCPTSGAEVHAGVATGRKLQSAIHRARSLFSRLQLAAQSNPSSSLAQSMRALLLGELDPPPLLGHGRAPQQVLSKLALVASRLEALLEADFSPVAFELDQEAELDAQATLLSCDPYQSGDRLTGFTWIPGGGVVVVSSFGGTVTFDNSAILANGANAIGGVSMGAGAGGSIDVDAQVLTITNSKQVPMFIAQGGDSTSSGGGGGGIISIGSVAFQGQSQSLYSVIGGVTTSVQCEVGSGGIVYVYPIGPALSKDELRQRGLLDADGGFFGWTAEQPPMLSCIAHAAMERRAVTTITPDGAFMFNSSLPPQVSLVDCNWALMDFSSISVTSFQMIGSSVEVAHMNFTAIEGVELSQNSQFSASEVGGRLLMNVLGGLTLSSSLVKSDSLLIFSDDITVDSSSYMHFSSSASVMCTSLNVDNDLTQADIPTTPTSLFVSASSVILGKSGQLVASQVFIMAGSMQVQGSITADTVTTSDQCSLHKPSGSFVAPDADSSAPCLSNAVNQTAGFAGWISTNSLQVVDSGSITASTLRVCAQTIEVQAKAYITASGTGCPASFGMGAGGSLQGLPGGGAGHGGYGGLGVLPPTPSPSPVVSSFPVVRGASPSSHPTATVTPSHTPTTTPTPTPSPSAPPSISFGGAPYDNWLLPIYVGSGGGGSSALGGAGGGMLVITSLGNSLSGGILADGKAGADRGATGAAGGGGSGGSVILQLFNLTGDGKITAKGGDGGSPGAGGGGGGIIVVNAIEPNLFDLTAPLVDPDRALLEMHRQYSVPWLGAPPSRELASGLSSDTTWPRLLVSPTQEEAFDSTGFVPSTVAPIPGSRVIPGDFSGTVDSTGGLHGSEAGTSGGAGRQASDPPCNFTGFGGALCEPCAPGSFKNTTGNSDCLLCEPGTFASGYGNSVCEVCPPGNVSRVSGSSSCLPCDPGYMPNPERTRCSVCNVGYEPTGIGWCSKCTYGYAKPTVGQTMCSPCKPGTYSNQLGSTECLLCPDGQFAPGNASQGCIFCQAGTHSSADHASCPPCNAGAFSHHGWSKCILCPNNTMSLNGSSLCSPCPPGQFSEGGAHSCDACPSIPTHAQFRPVSPPVNKTVEEEDPSMNPHCLFECQPSFLFYPHCLQPAEYAYDSIGGYIPLSALLGALVLGAALPRFFMWAGNCINAGRQFQRPSSLVEDSGSKKRGVANSLSYGSALLMPRRRLSDDTFLSLAASEVAPESGGNPFAQMLLVTSAARHGADYDDILPTGRNKSRRARDESEADTDLHPDRGPREATEELTEGVRLPVVQTSRSLQMTLIRGAALARSRVRPRNGHRCIFFGREGKTFLHRFYLDGTNTPNAQWVAGLRVPLELSVAVLHDELNQLQVGLTNVARWTKRQAFVNSLLKWLYPPLALLWSNRVRYRRSEAVFTQLDDFVDRLFRNPRARMLGTCLRGGVDASNSLAWIDFHVTDIEDAGGAPVGVVRSGQVVAIHGSGEFHAPFRVDLQDVLFRTLISHSLVQFSSTAVDLLVSLNDALRAVPADWLCLAVTGQPADEGVDDAASDVTSLRGDMPLAAAVREVSGGGYTALAPGPDGMDAPMWPPPLEIDSRPIPRGFDDDGNEDQEDLDAAAFTRARDFASRHAADVPTAVVHTAKPAHKTEHTLLPNPLVFTAVQDALEAINDHIAMEDGLFHVYLGVTHSRPETRPGMSKPCLVFLHRGDDPRQYTRDADGYLVYKTSILLPPAPRRRGVPPRQLSAGDGETWMSGDAPTVTPSRPRALASSLHRSMSKEHTSSTLPQPVAPVSVVASVNGATPAAPASTARSRKGRSAGQSIANSVGCFCCTCSCGFGCSLRRCPLIIRVVLDTIVRVFCPCLLLCLARAPTAGFVLHRLLNPLINVRAPLIRWIPTLQVLLSILVEVVAMTFCVITLYMFLESCFWAALLVPPGAAILSPIVGIVALASNSAMVTRIYMAMNMASSISVLIGSAALFGLFLSSSPTVFGSAGDPTPLALDLWMGVLAPATWLVAKLYSTQVLPGYLAVLESDADRCLTAFFMDLAFILHGSHKK